MIKTEDGGRKTAIRSGYRPNCWFGVTGDVGKVYNDCQVTFDVAGRIQPGEEADVFLTPFFPEYVRPIITIGQEFEICEGPKVVATGTITAISEQPSSG